MVSEREKIEISENFEKKGWGDEIRDYSAYKHGGLTYYKWAMHAMSNMVQLSKIFLCAGEQKKCVLQQCCLVKRRVVIWNIV